ncbi:FtsK/SpoIIIE domain-containing protein [Streptantibioticus rubrisoli]|uniref:FtsK/SpoIIIE domain-containing protein n=1 Tax=Streptantibioticus rubrisoli TaxID=1387313 RepID=A0ABT1PCA2_9ACTN|nr:FtsK/SpoIIIE domain-containing protein [Streptantibioticus rubrisoli]MCQ4043002.1 FtsK/SpoIIIE domain-containing protein [Streptantibioticus rubrisoli]
MSALLVLVALGLGLAGVLVLRHQRPAWYWLAIGGWLAVLRVSFGYSSVMEACGLTVPPSRMRLMLARAANREVPPNRPPRLVRMRITRTGLVMRLRLCPGQDAFDVATSTDRLRHSFLMHAVTSREVKAGVVEVRMTGYDVLRRVQIPARAERSLLRVPVALVDDGSVHYRDFREVPHRLDLGATVSGKSVSLRNLVTELAPQPVALVGIDCKQGVELGPLARRLSAFADNPDSAADLLEALVERMAQIYLVIRREQRISVDIPDAEITADIWGLPEAIRPTPVVLIVDEVAELLLISSNSEKKRRERTMTALVRLAQLGRAAGIYLEICGQRFGAELGEGTTMLRAQLTGRICHRVNDEGSAKMALADISPEAVLAATTIAPNQQGVAVLGDSSGGWVRGRGPYVSLRRAVNVCNRYAHLTPDLPELAPFRPALPVAEPVDLAKPVPASA